MENGFVKWEVNKGIATITFFHPSHNSLPSELLKALTAAVELLDKNEEVSLILLQSAGDRTFCAGASFDELVSIENFETGVAFFMGFANVINAFRKCSKLIIARVQGKAVGGGVGLAAAADYCLATKFAAVKLSELHIGIGPFVVGPAIQRKIGLSAMSSLALRFNEFFPASWAFEKGLYAEIYDDQESLDNGVDERLNQLASTSFEARKAMKKMLWEGTENWDVLLAERAAVSGQLVLSEATKKALDRYLKK